MAAQTSIQDKRKSKGRKRREYKRTPWRKQSVNNFWIWIVERNRFPKLTWFWQLHFTLQECRLKFTNGSPHKLPNLRQSLTHVRCSSIFYVWVSAANNWWQPKQASKRKGTARGGREENTSEHPQENNPSITFGSELWKEIGFPNWHGFDNYTLHYKNAVWSSQMGPLTSCQI